MKKFLLSLASLAMLMAPVAADAASQCRNAKGQFAKCGAPGAMTDAQYKAMKGKPAAPVAKPTPTPTAKPTPTPVAKPSPAPKAKPVVCRDAKKKFVKCGTPGAKPA